MHTDNYAQYRAASPYFDAIRGALEGLVDGEHFFDIVTADTIYEVRYDFPGWPRLVHGRTDLMAQFRGYVTHIELQSVDQLITYRADNDQVVVLEYDVHGIILSSGEKYNNRFCSIIKIENRKIAYWKDYMDSLTAWNTLTNAR